MGKYDDLVADIPDQQSGGKYDDLTADLDAPKRSPLDVVRSAASSAFSLPANVATALPRDPMGTAKKTAPYLPAAGGVLGSALGPVGTAAGTGLGQIASNMVGIATGDKKSPTDSRRAAIDAMAQTMLGGVGETAEAAKLGKVALPAIGNFASKAAETVSGVPARMFKRLYNDPSALFIPKTLKGAGEEFGTKLKALGINPEATTAEINEGPMLTVSRRVLRDFFKKKEGGVPVSKMISQSEQVPTGLVNEAGAPILKTVEKQVPTTEMVPFTPDAGEIIKAKRATDRVIDATPYKEGTRLRDLYKQKTDLGEMLNNVSGPAQQISKDYSRSALAAQFRKILPETQTGKISYVKNVLVPLATRQFFAPILSSPATLGLTTSAAGGVAKFLKTDAGRQALRASLTAALTSGLQNRKAQE